MTKGKQKSRLGRIEKLEKKELEAIEKIGEKELSIEKELKELKKEIRGGVVEKFTYKDIARGIVGAIFGMSIMGWHPDVRAMAMNMGWLNVAVIVVLTIIGGVSVLYYSQYRKIKETWVIHQLLPKRFGIFYLLSINAVFLLYLLFGVIRGETTDFAQILKLVLVVSMPAMIGASTADIIR